MVFYLQGVSTAVPPEYLNFVLCREFGWTYEQLMSQPADFVESMLMILNVERKHRNKNAGG